MTQQQQAGLSGDASDDEYRHLVENSREGIFKVDAHGVLVFANRRIEELLGYAAGELPGRHFSELIAGEDLPAAQQALARRRLGQGGLSEYRIPRKDGTLAWFSVSSVPIMDAGGAYLGVTGFVSDIDERKRGEERAAHELRLLRRIAGDVPTVEVLDDLCLTLQSLAARPLRCAVMIADAAGNTLRCLAAPSMPEEFRQKAAYPIRDDSSTCARSILSGGPVIVADAQEDGASEEVLMLRRLHGYGAVWSHPVLQEEVALGTLAFLPDLPGTPGAEDERLIAFGVQVARLALAHEHNVRALRASEQRFRDFADMAADWFWEQDAEFRFTKMSGGVTNKGGFRIADSLGRARWELPIEGVDAAQWAEHRARLDRHEIFRDFIYCIRTTDGTLHWYSINGKPIFAADGAFLGYRGTARDITAQVRAEQEVRELNATLEDRVKARTAELEAANQELDAFNYSVSHDLRAPLRSALGFSQALLEDYPQQLDDTGRDYLQRVCAAARRMGELIDAMYHLSKLSRSLLQIRPVDLSAKALAIADDLRQGEPGRVVEIVVAPGIAAEGDPGLLVVLLGNLLGNAWKYTARTQQARIEFFTETGAAGETAYCVRDNGAGFDMLFADKLFKLFQRLHREEDFGGQGVGLVTAQRVVRRHGGRIWASAEKGRSATFRFTLWDDHAVRREVEESLRQRLA
jgi:PAS domain S-box-containing protein